MAKRTDQFQTIRAEGALLPPDILQAIASLKVDGVPPQSYHLPPGTKLNEAIAHSWSVLQKYWKGFQEARQQLAADKPQDSWLEKWSHLAREQGTRVLSGLRSGVARAIEALGRGFLAHPRNDRLREKLQSGGLDTQEYYRQLLHARFTCSMPTRLGT